MGRGHELTTYTEEGKRVDIDLPINTKSGFPLGVYQDEENYLYAVGPWGVVGSRKPITGEMLLISSYPKTGGKINGYTRFRPAILFSRRSRSITTVTSRRY
jgi:hypothetical protein